MTKQEQDILEQVNEILKNFPHYEDRQRLIFSVSKQENKKWHVNFYMGNALQPSSEHSSRVKALNSLFSHNPRVNKFYVVIEQGE